VIARGRPIVTVEAVPMVNMVSTARAALPVWLVQLEVDLDGDSLPQLDDDDVEPMVELLYRTDGVRSVAIVPLSAGLAVALGIAAPDAAAAEERARRLVTSCARYAGLGVVAVPRATVTAAPGAGTA
jgi:hypothetical protein